MPKSRLLRYLVVGGTAYLIEMVSLYVLHNNFGFSSLAAVAISFWIGFIVAFFLQKFVAFQNHDKRPHVIASQLVGYAALVAWNYGFTLLAVKYFASHGSVFLIRTVVILIVTLWNYSIYKVLFKKLP